MRKGAIRITAGIIVLMLLLTTSIGYSENGSVDTATVEKQGESRPADGAGNQETEVAEVKAGGWEAVKENETLKMYIDKKTAEIALEDKRTGRMWYSNPQGRTKDPMANETYQSLLSSQVSLTYYNDANQQFVFNSYDESVKRELFEISPIDNGVKVTYNLTNYKRGEEDIPAFISKERFESIFLNKVTDEKELSLLKKRFVLVKDKNVYKRYKLPSFEVQKILDIMDKVGYTAEDLEIDKEENSGVKSAVGSGDKAVDIGIKIHKSPEKPVLNYTLSIEYTLDKDNLVVNVPAKDIKYTEDFPLHSIKVLEYFGAADTGEPGYIFVPDGSGALIYLNNGKTKYPPVNLNVYGQDYTIDPVEKPQVSQKTNLPVYGLKQGDHAFVAIIEKGDALAGINADIGGRHHSYNSVSSEFIYFQKGDLILGDGYTKQIVFQDKPYQGDYRVRYAFLGGQDANYVGMAKYYQKYLIEHKGFKKLNPEGDIPFYLETVGAIEKTKSFLGFPMFTLEPLTTFKEAQAVLQELQRDGVSNVKLRYSGWFNGGVRHSFPTSLKVDGKLGGAGGLKELARFAQAEGMELFPDVSFLNVYKKDKGFNLKRDAMKFISQDTAKVYGFNPATRLRVTSNPYLEGIPFNYYLSPLRLNYVVDKFLKPYQALGVKGISLKDLAAEVNSDSREGRMLDRQSSMDISVEQLAKVESKVGNLMVEGSNAFALPYAAHILNVPMQNSSFNLEDESIPFYQIVLHGYKEFAGEPLNLSEDYRKHVLKILETGASPYYKWIFKDNSLVKDSAFNDLYSVYYKNWIADAASLYKELNDVLRDVQDKAIMKHEKLQEKVYQVVYENGKTIVINYNHDSVKVGNIVIEGLNYKVVEGVK